MSFGDGGGYKHPDPATQQFLDGPSPAAAPTPAVTSAQVAAAPVAPAVPAVAPVPAPAQVSARITPPAVARTSAPSANAPVRPLGLTAADIAADDADAASAAASDDYDARVLGLGPGPRRPRVSGQDASAPSRAPSAPSANGAVPRLFVSIAIDPQEAGTLRDAVAALGVNSGFAADGRFAPTPGPDGLARVAGWIPAARLAEALRGPGIKSVSVAAPRPAPGAPLRADYRLGLLVSDPAQATAEVRARLRELAANEGFRPTRVVGLRSAADGRAVAVVEGGLPIDHLGEVLSLPDVASVEPLIPAPVRARVPTPAPGGLSGFARFAVHRGLWLILLTLLAALPAIRDGAGRLVEMFNPYH